MIRDGIKVMGEKHIVTDVDKLGYVKGVYTKGLVTIRIGKKRWVELSFV